MLRTTRVVSRAIAFILFLPLILVNAFAQSNLDAPTSYSQLVRSQSLVAPFGAGLLGESVDFNTGQTDFVTTDVSLPGNSTLPVAIARRFHVVNQAGGPLQGAFGDWDIEIPHIKGIIATGVGWTVPGGYPDERCSDFGSPPPATVTSTVTGGTVSTSVPSSEYSAGFAIVVPGQGRRELLLRASDNTYSPPGAHPVVTNDWWSATCLVRYGAPPGAPDEGFKVTSPDGVTYSFLQYSTRTYPSYQRPADTNQSGVMAVVPRQQAWLLPTVITDRFGNTITYTYTTVNGQLMPSVIAAADFTNTDTRKITITYTNNLISSITDQVHNWSYTYTNGSLTKVTLPDGSYWTINFANFDKANWIYSGATCATLSAPTYPADSSISGGVVSGTITAPTGASGTFTFNVTRHGRNSAPSTCLQNSAGLQFARVEPSVFDVLSLTKKVLTGPRISAMTWAMNYGGCTSTSCSASKTTRVTDARGYDTLYTFGAVYSTNASLDTEGQLQSLQSGGTGAGSYLRTDTYTYFPPSGQAYPTVSGTPAQVRGDVNALTTLRPVSKRVTTQDGATYTQTVSSSDQFGYPTSISRTGTDTKTDTLAYYHDTSLWVLGTLTKVVGNGTTELSIGLTGKDQPSTVSRFGRLDKSFTYNSDGTMATATDGSSNQTRFGLYFRGVPETVSYADGGQESVAVNNYGQITSWTDANNYITQYSYDSMQRLNGMTGPGGYNQTAITTYTPQTGWSSSETHGTYTKAISYDALLRPVSINEGSGLRTTTFQYDPDGRTTFASYPGSSLGITSTFDRLGRLSSTKDGANYQTIYTPGANSVAIEDANLNTTTFHFKNYDLPKTTWPTSIVAPGWTTTITRDAWGKPTSIVRGSIARTRVYDANQLLHTSTDPESGTTTFIYYGAGNIKTITRSDGVIETRAYDGRERRTSTAFSNGDSTITLVWNKNGSLSTATRGLYQQTEHFSTENFLTSEVIGDGTNSYTIGYSYDHYGVPTAITYPDNTVVSYYPDALGRPSEIGHYATNIQYYPNGAVKYFLYGNGISHSMTQTTDGRQLPGESSDSGVLDYSYTYDGNGNPRTITDHPSGTNTKTLTYDSSNRLKTASAPNLWGLATFTYDSLDNITQEVYGTTTLAYTIDPTTNRLTSLTGGQQDYSLTYDVKGNITGKSGRTSVYNAKNQLESTVQPLFNFQRGRLSRLGQYNYDAFGNTIWRTYTEADYLWNREYSTTSIYSANHAIYNVVVTSQDPTSGPTSSTTYKKLIYLGAHLIGTDITDGIPADEVVTYQHTDALGTPVAQTNNGKVVQASGQTLPYGEWFSGGRDAQPGFAGGQAGFAGGYEDGTGLVDLRARFYDPYLRRFISTDPDDVDISTGINFNRYSYALNSPYSKYDPSGRDAACMNVDDPYPCNYKGNPQTAAFVFGGATLFLGGAGAYASIILKASEAAELFAVYSGVSGVAAAAVSGNPNDAASEVTVDYGAYRLGAVAGAEAVPVLNVLVPLANMAYQTSQLFELYDSSESGGSAGSDGGSTSDVPSPTSTPFYDPDVSSTPGSDTPFYSTPDYSSSSDEDDGG